MCIALCVTSMCICTYAQVYFCRHVSSRFMWMLHSDRQPLLVATLPLA